MQPHEQAKGQYRIINPLMITLLFIETQEYLPYFALSCVNFLFTAFTLFLINNLDSLHSANSEVRIQIPNSGHWNSHVVLSYFSTKTSKQLLENSHNIIPLGWVYHTICVGFYVHSTKQFKAPSHGNNIYIIIIILLWIYALLSTYLFRWYSVYVSVLLYLFVF